MRIPPWTSSCTYVLSSQQDGASRWSVHFLFSLAYTQKRTHCTPQAHIQHCCNSNILLYSAFLFVQASTTARLLHLGSALSLLSHTLLLSTSHTCWNTPCIIVKSGGLFSWTQYWYDCQHASNIMQKYHLHIALPVILQLERNNHLVYFQVRLNF